MAGGSPRLRWAVEPPRRLALEGAAFAALAAGVAGCAPILGIEDLSGATTTTNTNTTTAPACGASTQWPVGWSRATGGSESEVFSAVAAGADGSLVGAGAFQGTFDFAGQAVTHATQGVFDDDVFVAKYDATGDPVWGRGFGDLPAAQDAAQSVAIDSAGDVIVAGDFAATITFGSSTFTSEDPVAEEARDFFLAELAGDTGDVRWARSFAGPGRQWYIRVAALPSGGVVIAAAGDDALDLGGCVDGPGNVLLARLDGDGNCVWGRAVQASVEALALATDPTDGRIALAGGFDGSVDFGTGPVSTMGVQDAFVAVFDENGTSLWTSTWSGAAADPANGNQLVRAIAFGPDGDVFATGSFEQSMVLGSFGTTTLAAESLRSIFLLRIDGASGDLAGARTFTAPGAQEGLAVAVDRGANVVIAGTLNEPQGQASSGIDFGGGLLAYSDPTPPSADYSDLFVARFDGELAHCQSRRHGDQFIQRPDGAVVRPDGSTVLAGSFWGNLSFGPGVGQQHVAVQWDAFVVSLGP